MNIYVAAPIKGKELAIEAAAALEAEGHSITHKWWNVEFVGAEGLLSADALAMYAHQDVVGVREADAVLLINSHKSEGKAVEQGIAIERDIPIITIGKRGEHSNNVFHYLSNYRWVETLPEAIKVIADLEWGMYYGREHERARDASTRGR